LRETCPARDFSTVHNQPTFTPSTVAAQLFAIVGAAAGGFCTACVTCWCLQPSHRARQVQGRDNIRVSPQEALPVGVCWV
jgi:hypothetical protein